MTISLEEEFVLYPKERAQNYLRQHKAPEVSLQWVASTKIIYSVSTGLWEPLTKPEDEARSKDAIVMPLVHNGEIIDLIAWLPNNAACWYSRAGIDYVLGRRDLHQAKLAKTPIKVHDTPFMWLLSGMRGCVPLTADACSEFMGCKEILCSRDMERFIQSELQRAYPFPKMVAC